MPKKVVSLLEAKAKDFEAKETYPKYRLSAYFGYGQFISSDSLFEVYDTKLVSQAEKDDANRAEKEQQRAKVIQDKREAHQQTIKNLLKNNLLARSSASKAVKYDMANMDKE